jgi:hypothetical protein
MNKNRTRRCKGCGGNLFNPDEVWCDQCKVNQPDEHRSLYEIEGDCEGCGESLKLNSDGYCRRCSQLYRTG